MVSYAPAQGRTGKVVDAAGVAAGVLTATGLGALAGRTAYRQLHKEYDLSEMRHAQQMAHVMSDLDSLVGARALIGKFPETVISQLNEAGKVVGNNQTLLEQGGLYGQFATQIPRVRGTIEEHFSQLDWRSESADWFAWLYGGTGGVDFELGAKGNILFTSPARGDEFYYNEFLSQMGTTIELTRAKSENTISYHEIQETNNATYNAFIAGGGGVVGGIMVMALMAAALGLGANRIKKFFSDKKSQR